MSFDRAPGHFELAGDFGVVTSLQQQFYDLSFPWAQPNGLVVHPKLPFLVVSGS
jgi:hypothetical protein